ncbi:MAG: hypothetical protein HYS33_07160, partial [Acidobacteria bacterium]|nr:hypothetical protein [Acidobacteriota bacterium]
MLKPVNCAAIVLLLILPFIGLKPATWLALSGAPDSRAIPRTWDDEEVASLEIPLAESRFSPGHVSSDYYYRIPVRPIYESYPVYHPDREPPGYRPWIMEQEPAIAFDSTKLKTEEDWTKAGEVVFDAPIDFDPRRLVTVESVRDRRWHRALGMPVAGDGTLPFFRYVIRQKGKVELGVNSCATCHARVMP